MEHLEKHIMENVMGIVLTAHPTTDTDMADGTTDMVIVKAVYLAEINAMEVGTNYELQGRRI